VGRGDDCDLRLSDPSVSRIHARITLVDGHVYLEDAGSRWGTLVNDRPTESRELFPGDCVAIGDTQLRLELESPLVTTIAPIHKRILRTLAGRTRVRRNGAKQTHTPEGSDGASTISQPKREPANKSFDITALVGQKFLRYRVESIVARSFGPTSFRTAKRASGSCGPCEPRLRSSTRTWSASTGPAARKAFASSPANSSRGKAFRR
jgi:pSer/pThr/pTyr-binding forkhead associated (FHA) protein